MQLVACSRCHAQYDVTGVEAKSIACRCGETLENRPPAPVDAEIRRCGACGALTSPRAERCESCNAAIRRDERDLSTICPECYARNVADSRFCTACGVAFRPEPIRAPGPELPCPVCGGFMRRRARRCAAPAGVSTRASPVRMGASWGRWSTRFSDY